MHPPLLPVAPLTPLNPTTVSATTLIVVNAEIAEIVGTEDTTTEEVDTEDTIPAAWEPPQISSLQMTLITIPSRRQKAPS